MNLEQQLKMLKNKANPSEEWFSVTRQQLTNRVNYILSSRELEKHPGFFISLKIDWLSSCQFALANMRKVMVLLIVGVISISSVLTAKASWAAVPGDTLYPVKRNILEKVELVLAPTAKDEAEVYLKHVATRLDEIRILNEKQDLAPEDRTNLINHTVLALNRDLTAARQSLKIAAKESSQTKAVVAIAKNINQSATDIKKVTLATVQQNQGEKNMADLSQSVSEAINSAEKANTESLDILLQKLGEGEVNIDDIRQLVTQLVTNVENRVMVVDKAAWLSGGQEVRFKVRQSLYNLVRESKPAPFDQPTIDSVRSQMDQAKRQLEEAKRWLEMNNFKGAVEWANQAKDITETVAGLLNKVSNLIDVPLLPDVIKVTSSTSTLNVMKDEIKQEDIDGTKDSDNQVTIIKDSLGQLQSATTEKVDTSDQNKSSKK